MSGYIVALPAEKCVTVACMDSVECKCYSEIDQRTHGHDATIQPEELIPCMSRTFLVNELRPYHVKVNPQILEIQSTGNAKIRRTYV